MSTDLLELPEEYVWVGPIGTANTVAVFIRTAKGPCVIARYTIPLEATEACERLRLLLRQVIFDAMQWQTTLQYEMGRLSRKLDVRKSLLSKVFGGVSEKAKDSSQSQEGIGVNSDSETECLPNVSCCDDQRSLLASDDLL